MQRVTAIHFLVAGTILVASLGLLSRSTHAADVAKGGGAQAAPHAKAVDVKKAEDANSWRYVWHNQQWWYWLPENRWVFWQVNRWNDYVAPAVTSAVVQAQAVTSAADCREIASRDPDETGPFYGHAQSGFFNVTSSQDEIGPFYGHAMSHGVFGFRAAGQEVQNRPYYGHADDSSMR